MIKDVIKMKAHSFDLNKVKILGGPFKHAMDLNKEYILALEPDRLLARFRKYAGLKPRAPQYEGWEAMSLSGHTLGHYLSACSMLYAHYEDQRFKDRAYYVIDELEICQNAHGDGYVSGIPEAKETFEEVRKGNIISKGFDLNGIWAPLYTIHKLFAGLRDVRRWIGNDKSLNISIKLADWLHYIISPLSDEQMQELMVCEYGGITEVLVDLYSETGNVKYLKLAQRFWHKHILDPLANKEDKLAGNHANTQIPKIIGLAREYEVTGKDKLKEISEFFWERVVNHHSYVTGGHSNEEYFGNPDELSERLGPNTTETCNTYNMLKLTNHLFKWSSSAIYSDYYERALFNHILASQDPDEGGVTYFLSLDMGGYKTYNGKFNHFTCCVGTGMENHASYNNSIYFHSDDHLFVNQFIHSSLSWDEKGVEIIQETNFPESNKSSLQIKCNEDQEFTLNIRYPYWAEKGIHIKINGEEISHTQEPGSYVQIRRIWKNNDHIEIRIPMTLRLESMPDKNDRVAIMYGPLVLAGELGPLNDPEATDYMYTPVMIPDDNDVSDWIQPVMDKPNTFKTVGVGHPRDVILYPFYKMHDRMYSVYWDIFTQDEWKEREADYLNARKQLNIIEKSTIDYAQPGEMQPERDHNFDGENTRVVSLQSRGGRTAYGNGWFSFDMKVESETDLMLVLTYAKEIQRLEGEGFDILIDGQLLENEPKKGFNETARFYNVNYKIPKEYYENKNSITIKFKAHPNGRVRRIFGIRIVDENIYKGLT